jgi:hypothetical protein
VPNKGGAISAKKSIATARCACGAVEIEVQYPAFWAWHDHSHASGRAHASAYATYVGSRKSRVRVAKGARSIRKFEDKAATGTRSFCSTCGTPVMYERAHAPKWVNIPRAIFTTRTGRQPRYHLHMEEAPEWAYRGEPLVPLKGYPGVLWNRSRSKKRKSEDWPLGTEPPLKR